MKTAFIGFLLLAQASLPVGQKIIQTALAYKVDPILMLEIARCESDFNPLALGDQGRAWSYFQFWRGTFENFKNEAGASYLRYENPDDGIELAVWAVANGHASSWTCYRRVVDTLG